MPAFELLIDGQMVPGEETLDVINPGTEELAGRCSRASESQLNEAVEAARKAFPAWSATPLQASSGSQESPEPGLQTVPAASTSSAGQA